MVSNYSLHRLGRLGHCLRLLGSGLGRPVLGRRVLLLVAGITRIPASEYAPDKAQHTVTSLESRADLRKAVSLIEGAFIWGLSAEGSNFWGGVTCRLSALAEGEPLK